MTLLQSLHLIILHPSGIPGIPCSFFLLLHHKQDEMPHHVLHVILHIRRLVGDLHGDVVHAPEVYLELPQVLPQPSQLLHQLPKSKLWFGLCFLHLLRLSLPLVHGNLPLF